VCCLLKNQQNPSFYIYFNMYPKMKVIREKGSGLSSFEKKSPLKFYTINVKRKSEHETFPCGKCNIYISIKRRKKKKSRLFNSRTFQ
jgi:hypothetical protein